MNTDTDSFQTSKEVLSEPILNDDDEKKFWEREEQIELALDSNNAELLKARKELQIASQEFISIKHINEFGGKLVARIAIFTPLIILLVLLLQLINPYCIFGTIAPIPQAIFISASFLSFIVIYTVLIKGLFGRQKEKESSWPIKELKVALREWFSHQSP